MKKQQVIFVMMQLFVLVCHADPTATYNLLIAVNENNVANAQNALIQRAKANATDLNGDSVMHIAARKGCVKMVALLAEYRADLNTYNAAGYTPLHLAVMNNHPATVSELLRRRARRLPTQDRRFTDEDLANGPNREKMIDNLNSYPQTQVTEEGEGNAGAVQEPVDEIQSSGLFLPTSTVTIVVLGIVLAATYFNASK